MGNQELLPGSNPAIEDVARGQRVIIFAVLLSFVVVGLRIALPVKGGWLSPWQSVHFGVVILAIVGLLRIASGFRYSTAIKVFFIVLSFIPFVNFVMLLVVNGRATRALKEAGYKVGILGARK